MTKRNLHKGDKVRCVDAKGSPLKQDATYTIKRFYQAPHRLWDDGVCGGPIPEVQHEPGVTIVEDSGRYLASRFALIPEPVKV